MNRNHAFLSILSLPVFRRAIEGGDVANSHSGEVSTRRARRVIRRYTGLAGRMRRQVITGVALGLFIGEIAIIAGYSLHVRQNLTFEETVFLVALIAMGGIMAGGLLTLRLMALSLDSIERVEASMKQMASAETHKAVRAAVQQEDAFNPLIQAYNLLVDHLDEIEAQNLEFLGKVTHDIRSPLASILGYAELMADANLRSDDQFLDKCQRTINKEGQQIAGLVQDAFLTAGLDTGRYEITLHPFHLERLVDELIKEMVQRSGREIGWFNRAGEVLILGDPIGMREAVSKLLDNALKFSSPGTPVQVILEIDIQTGQAALHVKDQGIGIDELEKAVLFRRFGRVRNDHTRGIAGAGLGLYIARNIVTHHHGEIQVESIPDQGSTFTILLPFARALQQRVKSPAYVK